ncbi:hypothetical protein OPKNFCMD_0791 [Methylobacterium crusticola]|uniref:Phytoene/squalene synthase family protein n=1 Tax=Methylobacterium crusticola TaxID=1697972 RepID=A0ABQ4QRY7_9HYPH|nr:phytoene/squalene synthase family protein [Methylobacterium crusticola]GJD48075.1 hypothetical protein OPKNFCMD_0791 [Methylobacterium crusticola]
MPRSSPETSAPAAPGDADRIACRAAIRAGSRSFYAASWLLPGGVRRDAYGLYAFCRLSDDAVDGALARPDAVARLQDRLRDAYAGRPFDHPADRALAETVARAGIPPALPEALLEGLAWDAAGRRYADLPELTAYAARVAGTVGAMMTLVMGVRSPVALARACDLGVAMQLTNIARDVGEDARAGRLYLPVGWMREAGLDPDAFLARPEPSAALRAVVARLLAAADALYARGETGIGLLPHRCRPAIRAAGLIYAEIGRALEANGLDPIAARARVPGRRKVALLARASLPLPRPCPCPDPPLPEVAFLVDAVAPVPPARPQPAWWDVSGRVVRVLDLIEALREREAVEDAAAS